MDPPIWESTDDAQQLRVCDVAEDARVWEAMGEPDPNDASQSHARRIQHYEERYRGVHAIALVLPAWRVPEGYVLCDGMHRACAVYRLAPPQVDIDLILLDPPHGWPDVQPGPRSATIS